MNFLSGVNRVLRINNFLRGDDDDITTFNDVQHNASLNMAIIAIQDELIDLVSDRLVNYEYATGTINTSISAPTYSLAADFVQFFGIPKFLVSGSTRLIFEYPGGLEKLQIDMPDFATQGNGTVNWWYFQPGDTRRVSFYRTPDTAETFTYSYEKDVSVTASTDNLPFHRDIEAQAFCAAAARRFKFIFEDAQNVDAVLANDASYQTAKSRLVRLMTGRNPYGTYGYSYR